jgi:hypothetical protein
MNILGFKYTSAKHHRVNGMRRELACLTVTLVLFCSMTTSVFAASPLFDGMYVVWTGSGEWDYNGLKSTIKISARLQSAKSATGYILSVSGSISGLPRTAPFLTQTVTFSTSGTDRTITYNNTQYYSPFWIDAGKNVGDKVQVGSVSSPYTFDLQAYESPLGNILGKNVRCLMASYSIRLSNPASITTISGRALFDTYSGVFVAGTMNYLFSSLQSPYYEKITAEATLSETNVEVGGPSLPWWLLPVIAGTVAAIAVVAFLVRQKRKQRAAARPSIAVSPVPPPAPPPKPVEPSPPPVTADLPEPSQPAPPLVLGRTCRLCGAAIRDGWTFCGDCGTPY